jgi:hypothetical protein
MRMLLKVERRLSGLCCCCNRLRPRDESNKKWCLYIYDIYALYMICCHVDGQKPYTNFFTIIIIAVVNDTYAVRRTTSRISPRLALAVILLPDTENRETESSKWVHGWFVDNH